MPLDAQDLIDDIMNDTSITGAIPSGAQARFEEFITRLSIHITEQIKRGSVQGVHVDGNGNQDNVVNVT